MDLLGQSGQLSVMSQACGSSSKHLLAPSRSLSGLLTFIVSLTAGMEVYKNGHRLFKG